MSEDAYIDADPNGGDDITEEVELGTRAFCRTSDRVGVEVVGDFPDRTVERWLTDGDIPLAFVFTEAVGEIRGNISDLSLCSDSVLHGYWVHQQH